MARVFSQEDANISKISASSTRTRPYKDIDLTFTASDIGNIFKKTETAAVKQAVKTLLNSNKFDKYLCKFLWRHYLSFARKYSVEEMSQVPPEKEAQ